MQQTPGANVKIHTDLNCAMKTLYILLAVLLGCSITRAQDIQTIRKTVIFKHTADWCGPCGGWGWELFDSLLYHQANDVSFNAVCMAVHGVSDQAFLNTPVSEELIDNTTAGTIDGIPAFVVENEDIDNAFNFANPSDYPFITGQYVQLKTAAPCVAGVGFSAIKSGADSVIVKARVQFLSDVTGEYRVAVMFLRIV
jgi:hypothetical protein